MQTLSHKQAEVMSFTLFLSYLKRTLKFPQLPPRIQEVKSKVLQYTTTEYLQSCTRSATETRTHWKVNTSGSSECLQTVGLCSTLAILFSEGMCVVMSVREHRKEQSVTIGYHSPGWEAVARAVVGESSPLTGSEGVALQMILGWQRGGGGGGAQSNQCNGFRHVWLIGLELNMSALRVDVDTTADSSCLSPHNRESWESRGDTFSQRWRLACIKISKTDDWHVQLFAPRTVFHRTYWSYCPSSIKQFSLPSYRVI